MEYVIEKLSGTELDNLGLRLTCHDLNVIICKNLLIINDLWKMTPVSYHDRMEKNRWMRIRITKLTKQFFCSVLCLD